MAEMREGRMAIDEAGHEIHYRLFGGGSETLMCLAGGPGGSTQYLTRLGELAGGDLQVLIHDQLGTGKSDRPDDPAAAGKAGFTPHKDQFNVLYWRERQNPYPLQ